MRNRRLRLALLAVALLGVVAWIVWPRTSAVIIAAREKYAQLYLGMPEAEVLAILGEAPEMDRQLYGEWADDSSGRKWIKLTDSPDKRKPRLDERLYHWRAWTFRAGSRRGWSYQGFHIAVYCEQGRLVAAYFYEDRDNAVKNWLRNGPFRSSRASPYLDPKVDEGRQAIPPS
jgi:hypothetical protein